MSSSTRVGQFEIHAVQDHASPARDPSKVYKGVPAEAWAQYKSIALEPDGTYRSQWRGHLVRSSATPDRLILVDTGMGPGPHQHTGRKGELLDSLSKLGVGREQVTDVVTTHVHGDHIGWNVLWDGRRPSLTFPNARYHVANADWEHYTRPANANEAFDRQVRPLKDLGALSLVEGQQELTPGVRTLPASGHTPGHQCLLVESEGATAVITGDLFHNVAQVTEQDWCPVYDWNTKMSTESRHMVLGDAQANGWVVCSGHLPVGSNIGRVVEVDGRPAWQAV